MPANLSKSKYGSWIILVLLLIGLPLVLLANKYSQDIRSKAVLWPQTLTRVLIAPGQITTSLTSSPTNLSALAYDQYDQPIVSGVTYEWGISSTNTVGTLNSHDNLAEFTPLNSGTGDLYVVARQGALNVTGSVAVDVSASGNVCIAINKIINVTPPGGSGACHDLQMAIDAVPSQNPQTSGPNSGYTVKLAPGTYYIPQTPNTFDIMVKNKDRIHIEGGPSSKSVHLVFTDNHGGIYIDNSSGSLTWMEISGLATNGLVSVHNSRNFGLGYLHLYDSGAHTLDMYDSDSVSLYNSEVSAAAGGVEVGNVQNLLISNNVIHDADNGISVGTSSGKIFANLISANRENGIRLNGKNQLTISSNTIVDNNRRLTNPLYTAAVFIGYSVPDAVSKVTLEKNIVAYNSGVGVGVRNEDTTQVNLALFYNDIYGNAQNFLNVTDPTGINGNISANPMFGSAGNETSFYCLLPNSPAIYGNPAAYEYMGHRGPCGSEVPPASPLPVCIYCQTDSDCPTGQTCAAGGYCHAACLDGNPRCLLPEPVCPLPSAIPTPSFTPEYLKNLLQVYGSWVGDFYPDGKFNLLDIALILAQIQWSAPGTSPLPQDQTLCQQSGGTWQGFPNSCADSCDIVNVPNPVCLQVITASCECGEARCWNGEICVDDPLPP